MQSWDQFSHGAYTGSAYSEQRQEPYTCYSPGGGCSASKVHLCNTSFFPQKTQGQNMCGV